MKADGKPTLTAACALAGVLIGTAATAAPTDSRWFIQAGPARIDLAEKARIAVAGSPVSGAGISARARTTAEVEVGYFVTPMLAVAVTAGMPVKQDIGGGGTIAPYGRLASATYGPAAVTVQWHPLRSGAVDPYVGVGVAYVHIFDRDDGALQRFDLDDDLGPALQVGVAVEITPRLALVADAKKAFLRADARGSLGPVPVTGRLRLDPLVLQGGIRFSL